MRRSAHPQSPADRRRPPGHRAAALVGALARRRLRRQRGRRPRPRPGAVPARSAAPATRSPRRAPAPRSAPTSTPRSPRRAPTAWTTTRSRASSRPRSRRPRVHRGGRARTTTASTCPPSIVTGQDAEDVATYVASVAGVPGAKPPQLGAAGAVRREVRHLPRARRRRDQLGHRSRPRRGARRQGRHLHRAADRRPELGDRPGLLRGGDAADFGTTLTPQDLKGLVDYLLKSVNGGGGQGG